MASSTANGKRRNGSDYKRNNKNENDFETPTNEQTRTHTAVSVLCVLDRLKTRECFLPLHGLDYGTRHNTTPLHHRVSVC